MLELDGLMRRFGDVVALDGVGFTVQRGAIHGFVGRNGAGKTTAMRIVMGVERAEAGTVSWDGTAVDAPTRRRFGYLPEERGLYPKMPPGRQLAYLGRLHGLPRAAARAAADGWLARFDLSERAGDPVEELSLGNQQRVQLAAALVHDPEVLILDEPFSGLDPVGTDAMAAVLVELAAAGCAVLFSSHQLDLVEELCHAVTIIDQGRVAADGPVATLRRGGQRATYRVRLAGGATGWAADLASARVLDVGERGVLVELVDDGDAAIAGLLDHARRTDTVVHFAEEVPTLAERYRGLVTPDGGGDRGREAA